jgi:hypothetical protein
MLSAISALIAGEISVWAHVERRRDHSFRSGALREVSHLSEAGGIIDEKGLDDVTLIRSTLCGDCADYCSRAVVSTFKAISSLQT